MDIAQNLNEKHSGVKSDGSEGKPFLRKGTA